MASIKYHRVPYQTVSEIEVKAETEQLPSLAFRNFSLTCRSTSTRAGYASALHHFMDYLKLDNSDYNRLLDRDPKHIEMDISQYILHMQEKGLASATVNMYLAAVRKFYIMNRITLNWEWIRSFKEEHERRVEDRPYTHSEIATLLKNTSIRNRAIILLMASSGPRVGAIPLVRIKDLEPIDKYGIYKITYYPKSKNDRYYTFCTPEARSEIDSYLEHRKRWGERITEESPLFRTDWSPAATVHNIRPISTDRVRNIINEIAHNSGIRGIPLENEGISKRFHIMTNHGLRKFFETNAYRAGMSEPYIDKLMGHHDGSKKVRDAYLKVEEQELLEGDSHHIGYVGIIDQLTIHNENRLQRKVEKLEIEVSKVDGVLADLAQMRQQLGLE